jgi:hypothetical protein
LVPPKTNNQKPETPPPPTDHRPLTTDHQS